MEKADSLYAFGRRRLTLMDDERAKRRQNPLPEKAVEVEVALTCVKAAFGRAWLEQGDSPLQRLWRRTDFFATAQLYLLGKAPGDHGRACALDP